VSVAWEPKPPRDEADQQVAVETRTAPVGSKKRTIQFLVASLSPAYPLIAGYCAAMRAREDNSESSLGVRAATGNSPTSGIIRP